MATNLASARRRRTSQTRITNNRDALIPLRRQTELPNVVVAADMRSALRGDPVEETRRALGLVAQTAENLGQLQVLETQARAPEERARAAMDAAAGAAPDPAMAKSLAYQDAYYRAKQGADFARWRTETDAAVDDLLNQGGGPDDVKSEIARRVQELRDRAAQDYPTPTARHALGVDLLKYVEDLDGRVATRIREQTQEETVNNIASTFVSRLDAGEVREPDPEPATVRGEPVRFAMPVAGRITSRFGEGRGSGRHNGVDIAAPAGSPVGAAAPGEVIAVGRDSASGNFVRVRHPDGSTTSYAHLASITVREGDSLEAGGQLGTVGSTGRSTGPHTHFVYRDPSGQAQDPRAILGRPVGDPLVAQVPGVRRGSSYAGDLSREFEAALALARQASVPPKRAKQAIIDAVILWGTNPEDPHPDELLALATAVREDGKTPSLSPEERQKLQNAAMTAMGYSDRRDREAREAAQDELEERLFEALESGVDLSAAVSEGVEREVFTPEEGIAWLNRFKTARKGEANQDRVLDFQLELTDPDADYADIRRRVTRAYNAGELGTGEAAGRAYVSLMRAAKERKRTSTKDPGDTPARNYLASQLRPDRDDLRENRAAATVWATAETEYRRRVANGEDPMKAANAVIDTYRPRIDKALNEPVRRPQAAARPAPVSNDAAVARVQALARERAKKMAELRKLQNQR